MPVNVQVFAAGPTMNQSKDPTSQPAAAPSALSRTHSASVLSLLYITGGDSGSEVHESAVAVNGEAQTAVTDASHDSNLICVVYPVHSLNPY
jgi:hypothetical protein